MHVDQLRGIQANDVYLIAQFLNRTTNLRTDEYGGSGHRL
jgi:2,4-dienoyl-CoA reductase-like NADH-dependent reductase (Old Yellow Enzyme family)